MRILLPLVFLIFPVLVFPVLTLPAQAENPVGPALTEVASEAPPQAPTAEGPAARLIEAHRLADLGQSARDPVLLFAAARLMQGLQLTETTLNPASPSNGGPADPTASAKPPTDGSADFTPDPAAKVPDPAKSTPLPGALNPATLFENARQMATPDSALRDAIAEAAAEIPAPPALIHVAALRQTEPQSFALSLPGGDPVQIGLLRLSGSLAYSLAAPDGTVLCQDPSTSAASLCTVTLPESQTLILTTTPLGTADWLLATP